MFWLVFLYCFRIIKGQFYRNVEQMIQKYISKHLFNILLISLLSFHNRLVQMFHTYFIGCVLDIKMMFEKSICNKQMYKIYQC